MVLNFKRVFLIDAVGALSSAAVTGLLLPRFVSSIGLPIGTLHFLAAVALVYAGYSFFCYWVAPPAKRFLVVIVVGNLLYCVLTASIVAIHLGEVATLGILYFVAEILIILVLVVIERNVLRKMVI